MSSTPASAPIAVSVVVPCFRDERALPALFARLDPALRALGVPVELVLVDDGSPDRTAFVAAEIAARASYGVCVIRLQRNFGQHAAVFAGLAHARGAVVVTLDSDLQHPPEAIAELVDAVSAEHPVVSAYRANRHDPLVRRLITRGVSRWLRKRTGQDLKDFGSMFRAYDRSVVEQLLQFREQRRFIPALVAWLGVPVREIPVEHGSRGPSGSRYRLGPLVDMALDLITGYAIFPLRLVVFLAFTGSALGFAATAGFAVYRVAVGVGSARLVSAFALVFFLFAIQLLVVALLGEYVGRIYTEVRDRPYYIIAEIRRNG